MHCIVKKKENNGWHGEIKKNFQQMNSTTKKDKFYRSRLLRYTFWTKRTTSQEARKRPSMSD